MDKVKITVFENLLRLPYDSGKPVEDCSVLTCGCLVSESYFLQLLDKKCPTCLAKGVGLLSSIEPLRELYQVVQKLNFNASSRRRRRSSSKRSEKGALVIGDALNELFRENTKATTTDKEDSVDFMTLFYKIAKEETKGCGGDPGGGEEELKHTQVNATNDNDESVSRQKSTTSIHVEDYMNQLQIQNPHPLLVDPVWGTDLDLLSEEKEYNFSKCFPFHRKFTSYPTLQSKFKLNFILLKSYRIIASDIISYFRNGQEVMMFVFLTEKRWEIYEFKSGDSKPEMVCCGKLTGEYGPSPSSLRLSSSEGIVNKSDFNYPGAEDSSLSKRLQSWDHIHCKLASDYLLISGSKGVLRVYNLRKGSKYLVGQPIYTYVTNFPLRCISISPNQQLLACGIVARERLSGREQPFIILHKMNFTPEGILKTVEPITITVPYRDPIKLISFNATSSYILCCTAWESRYLIIKIREFNDNYRRPRLVWTDYAGKRSKETSNDKNDNGLEMTTAGITDIQFGIKHSNTIIITSCSIKNTFPEIVRLEGATLDSERKGSSHTVADVIGEQESTSSRLDEVETSYIRSSELALRFPEVGPFIHKLAISPRGDGLVFLRNDGNLYLVSTPNLSVPVTGNNKKIVVLLGEVAGSDVADECASISFSADGGKVYAVDRRGILYVYDFTKGVPGQELDVVKCKIINA
ncbi:SPS-sensor component ptr3 [Scheffersomyces spartinae]|uniref:SPS-sensor component ptr3 n=1 Tax=Scheffersomyces spartinae TaxID=45513 RepID=A0A9P7VBJ6_9ASCO|nr:SPS-sensor component ptr3 [Scheffersomyces spartinae]KAG7194944.1 SPS-sensor component ptr3 [Scheffersomyces spartinae]